MAARNTRLTCSSCQLPGGGVLAPLWAGPAAGAGRAAGIMTAMRAPTGSTPGRNLPRSTAMTTTPAVTTPGAAPGQGGGTRLGGPTPPVLMLLQTRAGTAAGGVTRMTATATTVTGRGATQRGPTTRRMTLTTTAQITDQSGASTPLPKTTTARVGAGQGVEAGAEPTLEEGQELGVGAGHEAAAVAAVEARGGAEA